MKDIHIPNGYFHLWRTYLAEHHISPHDLAGYAQIQPLIEVILATPISQQSSYSLLHQLLLMTQQHIERPELIYDMARWIRPEHFGVLGYMATRSESVAEALGYIRRFSRLVIDGDEITPMQMSQQGKNFVLSWPFLDHDYDWVNEMTNAFIIALARQILPLNNLPIQSVSFAHPPKIALYHYQKFYGCEVLFEQPEYNLVISLGSLDLKIQHADPSLIQVLIQQAEEAIASKAQQDNLVRKLQMIVAEYLRLQQHAPKIEDLANAMHVSVRTLQRQLAHVNTSFKAILETERIAQCEKLLMKDLNLTEIALQLGYSDQSALARAYKAATGQTLLSAKKRYRQRNL